MRLLVGAAVLTAWLALAAPTDLAATVPARDRFVRALNAYRVAHRLPRVRPGLRLEAIAQRQSDVMARDGRIHHDGAHVRYAGFDVWNESVLWHSGPTGAVKVLRAWLASPPHRWNLELREARIVGVGVTRHADRVYWTCALAAR